MLARHAAAVVLASALAALPLTARAADPAPQREVGFGVKNGHLTVSVGLQDLFGDAERARLKSGFATRVLIRAALEELSRAIRSPSRSSAPRSSTTSGTRSSPSEPPMEWASSGGRWWRPPTR
jgi:hypothetical protein